MDNSSTCNSFSNYSAKNSNYDSQEESSWTFYFQDFMSNNNNNYNEQNSLCSDELLINKNGVLDTNENNSNSNKFVFKKRKMKGAAREVDDDLQDTASSPVNSPKVSYMNELCISSQKGKSSAGILELPVEQRGHILLVVEIFYLALDISKMWRDPGAPADSFYLVRPECKDVPKSKFRIKNGKTLSARKWHAAFSPEGYLDIGKTLGRIHRGGIHPSIRGEVWEFLLGCFDPKSTYAEREDMRQQRRTQYAILKEECRTMFPVIGSGRFITAPVITEDGDPILDPLVLQEAKEAKEAKEAASGGQGNGASDNYEMVKEHDKRVIEWKLSLHQIGLDVARTDRSLVFYEKQENLSKLWDILSVYAWFDKDVNYCQGMSDLCSPMIILLDDEADAFWCFERLMRRLRGNFRYTDSSVGVESQLNNLASVTQIIDPKLHQHLDKLGGGDYLFAVRMLMVLFRREFSFCDSLYLWEMMWALEYDPDLFLTYEDPELIAEKAEESKAKGKSRQCGKFERENMKNAGKAAEAPLPISVFLVASVLKDKSDKLLTEARGLDDVVKILNDVNGNLDAKKACTGAMKLHKKYLKKAANTNR